MKTKIEVIIEDTRKRIKEINKEIEFLDRMKQKEMFLLGQFEGIEANDNLK
tara:strand:- start:272 stop:424 length:153 start_codon:yes stop_codon:yes gene_type:complete